MDQKEIYRKSALDRMASPEELDTLMRITSSRGWIALLTMGFLLLMVVLWSIFGEIPIKIYGKGILINRGGVQRVKTAGAGQLVEVHIREGFRVNKDDLLFELVQPDLVDELAEQETSLAELEQRLSTLSAFYSGDTDLQKDAIEKQRANLTIQVDNLEQQAQWYLKKKAAQSKLLEKGLIIKQNLIDTENSYNDTLLSIKKLQAQLTNTQTTEFEFDNKKNVELDNASAQVKIQRAKVKELKDQIELYSIIKAPSAGRILSVPVRNGDRLLAGTTVVTMEPDTPEDRNLQAVIYIMDQGKQATKGMTAQISPVTVKKEKFGSLVATVSDISEFPISTEGIIKMLGNQNLAEELSNTGAPIQIVADLIPDSSLPSGYRWTSSLGPGVKVTSGVICTASIVVSKKQPIQLVIPYIKYFFGL
ncbi:MAG: NHLP bacteriocin system secretion protein [Proteobacteria bacterium]|nr:NHLP bacteriocin system secretion protein [Pseudomonadota bacterium]MBU1057253.1 NHLP bacteriocin system secretion protein [Pseudomonadota bacterium]